MKERHPLEKELWELQQVSIMAENKIINGDVLKKLLVRDGMMKTEIAKYLGITVPALIKLLKKHKLYKPGKYAGKYKKYKIYQVTKNGYWTLANLNINKDRSTREIAKMTGKSHVTVLRQMRSAEITARSVRRGRKIGGSNYTNNNYCRRCKKWMPKSVGSKCPDCNKKMKTGVARC